MLTDRDYELLSAYLDDALALSERDLVESRLRAEAELRDELEALRATVSLLNNLPIRKAPRDFVLDARFARRSSTRWLVFPTSAAFSALSAAAAMLLIVISSLLLNRNTLPQSMQVPDSGATVSEQQLAFSPTEGDANGQFLNRNELEDAASGTLPADDVLNGYMAATSLPQPSSVGEQAGAAAPPAIQQSTQQLATVQLLATQTTHQLFAAPDQAIVPATAAALSTIAASTAISQEEAPSMGLAQEAQRPAAEGAMSSEAAASVGTDLVGQASTTTPTPTATPTAAPTAVAVIPTEALFRDGVRDQQAVSDPLPLLVLAVGLVLLGTAVATTIVRWRNR